MATSSSSSSNSNSNNIGIEQNTSTSNNSNNNKNKDKHTDNSNEEEKHHDERLLECNICLDTAKDPVVSMCGHIFCWPCLHQWLETRPNRQVCPVCKAAISKKKVIPLYGRGSTKHEDPRNNVPPRPAGQRTEPDNTGNFLGFDGFHMSFGIGSFPFRFITTSFNFGDNRPNAAAHGTPQFEDDQLLSKIFIIVAIFFLIWLVFA